MLPRFHAPTPPSLCAFLLILALCPLPFALHAQYFSLGTDPASVKWHQVTTGHFRVIFPDNLDSAGLHVANALEYFREPGSASLNARTPRWPVILHGRTAESNATTPYAPKRIDMLTMPPQENYGQDWLDQLVIHEFRHAVQYASLNKGITKALTVLMGQQAVPAVMGLFVPFWFIEGDAVGIETSATETGRGRVPAFEMKLRAQFVEKGLYSYDKAYNGSYRDFTADWYELGYLLTGHTRLKYGPGIWSRVMQTTGKIPLMLVPFSNTLYRQTGFGKSRLYDTIASELRQTWAESDSGLTITKSLPVMLTKDRNYTNRTQPGITADGRIVYRKSGMDDIPRIMSVNSSGQEIVLVTPGYMIDECLSVAGNKICWAEMKRDPRWDLQSYSVIVVYNLENRTRTQLTEKSKYFAPDLDRSARKIAAIENDPDYRSFLAILDASNGNVIAKFEAPPSCFLSYPSWSTDGNRIAVIMTRQEGKCLAVADADSGEFSIILPYSNTEISKPSWYGHYILFTGAYDGKDNIYALDSRSGKLYQVTSGRFGATDAIANENAGLIIYSDYSADGYRLSALYPDPESWKEQDPQISFRYPLAEGLASQDSFRFRSDTIPDSAYQIKPYRRGLNLFNFHSWAPLAVDIDNTGASPGITLISQNLLGTSYTTLGYEYDLNEETGKYRLKYSYEGCYPAISLESDYGLRRGVYTDSTHRVNFKYNELNLGAGVSIPLNWYAGSWFTGFRPSAGYSYKYRKMAPDQEVSFKKERFNSLSARLYFYSQSRSNVRDINPPWAQVVDINFSHTLLESDTSSSIFSAEVYLYFPGILKHHSVRLYTGYQDRISRYYSYSDQISMARGYSGIYGGKLLTLSGTYQMPVFYPDWHIGPLLYLKRMKAGLFYDETINFDTKPYRQYNSIGIDLTFDFHLFRWFTPLEAGLRSVYFPQNGKFGFEFLYSVDLSY